MDILFNTITYMIKAVLFDWNWVIIDDLDAVARANCDCIFALWGEKVSAKTWFKEIQQDWHIFFVQKGVKKEDVKKVLPLMKNFYPKYIKYIKLISHITEVLDFLYKNKIKMGILSNIDRFSIESNIKKFGLQKYFEFIISGEDVKKPKPDPEWLEKAADYFKVNPKSILYVDDMPTVFTAAKKIGMITVGFVSRISEDLSDADQKINDIRKIIDFVKK